MIDGWLKSRSTSSSHSGSTEIYAVRVCVIGSPQFEVLSPDHVSHAVAVIEKPFLEHLLVKSRSVEATAAARSTSAASSPSEAQCISRPDRTPDRAQGAERRSFRSGEICDRQIRPSAARNSFSPNRPRKVRIRSCSRPSPISQRCFSESARVSTAFRRARVPTHPRRVFLIERLRARKSPLLRALRRRSAARFPAERNTSPPTMRLCGANSKPHRLPYTRGSRVIAAEGLGRLPLCFPLGISLSRVSSVTFTVTVFTPAETKSVISNEKGNISASVAAALFRLHKQSYGNPPRRNEDHPSAEMLCIKRKLLLYHTEFMKSVYSTPTGGFRGRRERLCCRKRRTPSANSSLSLPSLSLSVSNCHSPFRFIQLSRINCGFGCSVRNITVSLRFAFVRFYFLGRVNVSVTLPSFAMAKLRFSVAEDHRRRADPVTAAARHDNGVIMRELCVLVPRGVELVPMNVSADHELRRHGSTSAFHAR